MKDQIDELKEQIADNAQKIRELKRQDSELNLKVAVNKVNSDEEKDVKEIMKACYDYIAQHRNMFPKSKFVTNKELKRRHK